MFQYERVVYMKIQKWGSEQLKLAEFIHVTLLRGKNTDPKENKYAY